MTLKSSTIEDHWLGAKLPPQAIDIEESVLSAAILFESEQHIILEKLTEEDFYDEQHMIIFKAIKKLADNGNPINMRTVASQIAKNGDMETLGGPYKIAELTSKVSSGGGGHTEYHCLLLVEQRIKRSLIGLAHDIGKLAYDPESDAFDLLKKVNNFSGEIYDKIKSGQTVHVKEHISAIIKEIDGRTEDKLEINGIPSGFTRLDKFTCGWQNGSLILVAARPSMGKTTFVLNILRNASVDFKIPVAIFSLEMTAIELTSLLIVGETEITSHKLKTEKFSMLDMQHLVFKTAQLAQADIYIDDGGSLSISDLRMRARKLMQAGVKLIVVDYLQLMKGDHNARGNREQEISNISRGLKSLAKELTIPIIALSQLSREVEKRPDKKPMLADLRESGSLEQDADIVMFLWRPGYYKITGDESGTYVDGITKLILAKHRGGPIGETFIQMIPKRSKFINVDSPYLDVQPMKTIPKSQRPEGKTVEDIDEHFKPLNDDDLPF